MKKIKEIILSQKEKFVNNGIELLLVIPLFLMIAIVPVIVRAVLIELPDRIKPFWINERIFDMYSYTKGSVIFILGVMMLLFICFLYKPGKIAQDKQTKFILFAIILFVIFSVLSTIFSAYPEVAYWGSPNRREGLWIILSYILIVIYCLLIIRREKVLKYIEYAILILAFCISFLGIAHISWRDLLFEFPLKYLVIPKEYIETFYIEDRSHSFLSITLHNPNFVGSYCVLMLPMLTSIFMDQTKTAKIRILSGILLFCTTIIFFFSRSQAGMVGMVLALSVSLYYFLPKLKENKNMMAVLTGGFIFIVLTGNFLTEGMVLHNVKDIAQEVQTLFSKDKDYVHDPTYGEYIYDIEVIENTIDVKTLDGNFKIKASDGPLEIIDETGSNIRGEYNDELRRISLKKPFEKIFLQIEDIPEKNKQTMAFYYGDIIKFIVVNDPEEGLYLSGPTLYRLDKVEAPHCGFEGKENIASDRGYIWSRTIPLLKETFFIGRGPDNFLMYFPQGDYLAKSYINDGNPFLIVDKPHNMYLQWAVNEGVVATLGIISAFALYIVDSFRIYKRKNAYSSIEVFGITCLVSVIGYLGTGFFNDSVVSVAPIFWSIFGTGMSVNVLVKSLQKNHKNG